MAKFSEIDLDDFGFRIGFKNGALLKYLDSYYNYYRNEYPLIVRFFLGELNKINAQLFLNLDNLIKTAESVSNAINSFDYALYYLKDWEIVDYLEELKCELYRLTKTSKFLRSSKTNDSFSGTIEFTYPLDQGKTIEDVASEALGSKSYDDDFIDIAARNDLSEVDYDLDGGKNLVLEVSLNSVNSEITSVVDNITGERVYGLDLDKKLTLVNDDLKVLGYKDTIFQAVVILANLMKGDHPEFKSFGRSNSVGLSYNLATAPTVFREITKVFSSDDTLTNFTIEDIKISDGSTQLRFSVGTRLELIIKQNINI
jgi:hypothetical protein